MIRHHGKHRQPATPRSTTCVPWLVAAIALSVGLALYLFIRPEDSTPLLVALPAVPNIAEAGRFAIWINWLPSFIHVFAFSLLTWLVLGRRYAAAAAGFWCAVNLVFEYSQLQPALLQFLHITYGGAFDSLDVVACLLGGLSAWGVSKRWQIRRINP